MKWKALAILCIIVISLFPLYLAINFTRKMMRPRDSLARLFAFMLAGFGIVFVYTFAISLLIRLLFPPA